LEYAVANVQIALRKWKLDAEFTKLLGDSKVHLTAISARAVAHLTAPDHQLKIDRVVPELLKKNARCRFLQSMRILVRNGEQCITHSWNIAAVRDTNRDTEAHTPIAVCPVGHRRIDELCVWHDHHDVVVGANNRS